jgi:hypothetical protein
MATSNIFDLPYPLVTDQVNVHGDIEALVDKLEAVLPPLGVSAFQIPVLNNSGETFIAGTPVYVTGYANKTTVARYTPLIVYPQTEITPPILGLTRTLIANNSEGIVIVAGVLDGINLSDAQFEVGKPIYVNNYGELTTQAISGAVGIVAKNGVDGVIIVEAKGNGTWGALKNGLA